MQPGNATDFLMEPQQLINSIISTLFYQNEAPVEKGRVRKTGVLLRPGHLRGQYPLWQDAALPAAGEEYPEATRTRTLPLAG